MIFGGVIGVACVVVGACLARRFFRFIRGDCDLKTLSARINTRSFQGKVVWITGASSGIGAALAVHLAKHGALLILTSRREEKLNDLADQLPCPRDNVYVLPLDLTNKASYIEEVASNVSAIFGRLDYVFNNAGVSSRVSASDLEMEGVQRMFQINFFSAVALTRACLRALRETPGAGGTIVNTVSIAAAVQTPLRSPYCASKSALASYFRCLDLEERNVRVVNIYPGSVRTPIAHNAMAADGKTFGRSDPNIEAGLDPGRVADRMLAAVSAGQSEAWIAKPKELMATRLATWMPGLWSIIASKRADAYRRSIEGS
ncbi:Dehydrogenase/reductase SDR family member 7B [Gracilariopsis chorda]|uniref:Dehydrogenase/reductase SDR family member 7B n=1 Tax=Gracilariopsis chorda TaxID=448386 RepID=A0A2V3IH26_9FLOR|nr:Dehydrogenase/reductase SDR family member 7B [Gracilariopsis chorda]|eukprot:PXF41395.1 Dehydrogenase/reductase SDR family member 7B [Gracilariopsis chorda]